MASQEHSEPGLASLTRSILSLQTLLCLQGRVLGCPSVSLVCLRLSTDFGYGGWACCRQSSGAALAQLSPGTTNPPGLCPALGWALAIPSLQAAPAAGKHTWVWEGMGYGEPDTTLQGIFTFPHTQSTKPHTNQLDTQHRAAMAPLELQVRDAGLDIPGWHEANQLNSLMLDWRSAGRQRGRGERSEGEGFVQKSPFLEGGRDISW